MYTVQSLHSLNIVLRLLGHLFLLRMFHHSRTDSAHMSLIYKHNYIKPNHNEVFHNRIIHLIKLGENCKN